MSITAVVENDTIKLPIHVPDGTQVEIVLPEAKKSFADRFQGIIGTEGSGIGDLADNHDHYLYGGPKKV